LFYNTLKINMRLSDTASEDAQGFMPVGGSYTAATDTWHMTVQQIDINTESNITDESYHDFNQEWFINNPNILIDPNF